ncbi:MAG TPA: hypothetical protein ENJ30_02780 [Desulfobulbaceae bacterium]|nr:hypothetical protein [Desulfobulbaceae bacterium]
MGNENMELYDVLNKVDILVSSFAGLAQRYKGLLEVSNCLDEDQISQAMEKAKAVFEQLILPVQSALEFGEASGAAQEELKARFEASRLFFKRTMTQFD